MSTGIDNEGLEFGVLGPLEIRWDGRALELGSAKVRALLAILLLHANKVVSTESLIDQLWGERPPPRVTAALQVYVSRLRKLLVQQGVPNELIQTRPPGYLLRLEEGQLDLQRFLGLTTDGRSAAGRGDWNSAAEHLADALELWRGPALADIKSSAFARDEGARLEELRLAALEDRIDADLSLGRHEEVIGELESLVAHHPLRERPLRQLMLALYRSGRQAEALAAYQAACRLLDEELGLRPSEALRQLEKQILNQDPSLSHPLDGLPLTLTRGPRTLVGRERELGLLQERVERVGEQGGALVVRGEAGVGKSALLEATRRTAVERGMATLTTAGVQSEANLAFAGLHQLLRPAPAALASLPGPQRAAVEAAFGLTEAAAPDFFLIALAALDLLGDIAAAAPLLLVIEDAHWLDTASSDVLTFAARRLELEPIVVLFAIRDGFTTRIDQAGLPELRLEALDETASAAVLDASAPDLPPAVRQRVLAEALGNPLALVELPRALVSGFDPSSATPLPLTERLERAFAARLSGLPAATRTLLLVAALDDGGGPDQISAAASLLEGRAVGVPELSAAAAAGAVTIGENELRFRHPLVRSAIYRGALAAERRAAHAALADVYSGDRDRSIWHRAASLAASDDQVAAELEAAAERALRRGAPAVAASALERAAQLATEDDRRGRLLIQAAWINFGLGQLDVGNRLLHDAQQLELAQREHTMLLYMLDVFEQGSWSGAATIRSFVETAEQLHAVGETRLALDALLNVSARCWWANADQETRDLVVAAAERLLIPEDTPALLAILARADPVKRGAVVAGRLAATTPADVRDPAEAHLLSVAAAATWAQEAAVEFGAVAIDGFRAQGRLGLLAQALVNQAWAGVHLANPRLAIPAAEEAVRLADEVGLARWAAAASLALATMAAEHGDTATSAALAAQAEHVLLPMGANPMLSLVQFARGRAAIAEERFSDAYDEIRRIFDPADIRHHPYVRVWAVADLVDAAVHGDGDVEETQLFLAQLESLAATTGAAFLRSQLSYARPLLAGDDQAESLFKAALAGELERWPCFRGRMLLAYGGWLRRQVRVSESQAQLRAAEETFAALGSVTLCERAQKELRATGETARRRTPGAWAQLTPQELQIAQMAAAGLTNREIGQKLYLSHRTIEYHLHRIFPKLGIAARSQLRDVISEQALV